MCDVGWEKYKTNLLTCCFGSLHFLRQNSRTKNPTSNNASRGWPRPCVPLPKVARGLFAAPGHC